MSKASKASTVLKWVGAIQIVMAAVFIISAFHIKPMFIKAAQNISELTLSAAQAIPIYRQIYEQSSNNIPQTSEALQMFGKNFSEISAQMHTAGTVLQSLQSVNGEKKGIFYKIDPSKKIIAWGKSLTDSSNDVKKIGESLCQQARILELYRTDAVPATLKVFDKAEICLQTAGKKSAALASTYNIAWSITFGIAGILFLFNGAANIAIAVVLKDQE